MQCRKSDGRAAGLTVDLFLAAGGDVLYLRIAGTHAGVPQLRRGKANGYRA